MNKRTKSGEGVCHECAIIYSSTNVYINLKKITTNTLSQFHKEPELILLLEIIYFARNLLISQLSASR